MGFRFRKSYSKFHNVKTVVDGIKFDSRAESEHYLVLKDKLRAGEIKDLVLQKRYPLVVNGEKIAVYVADFSYTVVATGEVVISDVKSPVTAKLSTYVMKRKLIKALFHVSITEVMAQRKR